MEIPLFPLHTVLAPGIALPLHIFEPRYRVMVQRCLDEAIPFGVVLIREGSEVAPADGVEADLSIAAVGTMAEIREANKYSDGRWQLLVVGTQRFAIMDVHADREPYLVAEVEPLDDEPDDPDEAERLVDHISRRFLEYLRLLQPRAGEQVEPIDVQMELEVADADDEADDDPGGAADALDTSARLLVDPVRDDAADDDGDDGDEDDEQEAEQDTLRIPRDPASFSYLLTGIVQVELDRRQALLEAASAVDRLRDLDDLLDREMDLLARRLAPYAVDRRILAGTDN